jgi:hypothetical protein
MIRHNARTIAEARAKAFFRLAEEARNASEAQEWRRERDRVAAEYRAACARMDRGAT